MKASQYEVNATTKKTVESFYSNLLQTIASFTDIYKVDATISQSSSFKEKYERIIENEIKQWLAKQEEESGEIIKDPNEEEKVEVGLEKINIKELFFVKRLNNEADVDKFIHSLSDKLKSIVKIIKISSSSTKAVVEMNKTALKNFAVYARNELREK